MIKTVWKDPGRLWSFYCPLCEAERVLPFKPNPAQFKYFARVALTAAMVTLLTWPWFGWKGLVSFVPLWTIFETFYRTRARVAARCSQCGFDPFLTLVDAKKARMEIEAHWRKKFEEKGIPYPEKGTQPVAIPAAGVSKN